MTTNKPYLSIYLSKPVLEALAVLQEREPGRSRSALVHQAIIAAAGKGAGK